MLPPHSTQPPTSNRPQQAPARPPPAQLSCGQDAGSTGEHLAPKGVTLKCQRWWGLGQRAHCPPSGQVIKGIFLPSLARTMPHVPAPGWGADQHPAGPRGKLLVAKDKGQCCGTSVPSRQPCAQLTGRCYLGRYVQGTPGDACGRRNLAHPAPANLPAEPREEGGCWLPVAVRKPGLQSEGRKALGGGRLEGWEPSPEVVESIETKKHPVSPWGFPSGLPRVHSRGGLCCRTGSSINSEN